MAFSRVYYGCFVLFGVVLLGGCETTKKPTNGQRARDNVGETVRSTLDDIEAVEIVNREDGYFDLPVFDFDTVFFVVDTSGSMRESSTNRMRPDVVSRFARFLDSVPTATHIELIDGSGHRIGSWNDEGLSANPVQGRLESLTMMVKSLSFYPYESESNWLGGLRRTMKIFKEEAAGLRGAVFVFGDEYTGKSFEPLEDLVSENQGLPINVIRAHEGLLLFRDVLLGTSSVVKFEQFGSRIAELTGGRFYRFVPSAFSQSAEAVLLWRLAKEHPDETWYVAADEETVASWNGWLRVELRSERTFLMALPETGTEGVEGLLVSLKAEEGEGFLRRYYVGYETINGTKAREYRASLRAGLDRYSIDSWELLWEMD